MFLPLTFFLIVMLDDDPKILNKEYIAISSEPGYEPFYGPLLPGAVVTLVLVGTNGKSIVEGVLTPFGNVRIERVIKGVDIQIPSIYEKPDIRNLLNCIN